MYCSNTERPGEFVKLFPGTASSQAVPKAAVQVDGKRKYVCRKHVNLQDRAFDERRDCTPGRLRAFDERRDCTPGRLTHERQKILHFAKNYYCQVDSEHSTRGVTVPQVDSHTSGRRFFILLRITTAFTSIVIPKKTQSL